MLYDKVSTDLNFVDREQKVLEFWKQNEIFKKSIKLNKINQRPYPSLSCYEGI